MSRTEVVKRCWDYIKEKGLQDPSDRRYIMCDERLRPVFGERVHMFTMNKVLSGFMKKAENVEGGLEMEERWRRKHPVVAEEEVKEEEEVKQEDLEGGSVKSEEVEGGSVKSEEVELGSVKSVKSETS